MTHKHPEDTCYHFCYAAHPVTGQSLQEACDSIENKPFGGIQSLDISSTFSLIDCHSENLLSTYPELDGFGVSPTDPDFLWAIGLSSECVKYLEDSKIPETDPDTGAILMETHTVIDPGNVSGCLAKIVVINPLWQPQPGDE